MRTPLCLPACPIGSPAAPTAGLAAATFINEKLQAPDPVQVPPLLAMAPAYSQDPVHGLRATQAERILPQVDIGQAAATQRAETQQSQTQAVRAWQSAFAQGASQAYGSAAGGVDSRRLGQGLASSTTDTGRFFQQAAQSAVQSAGVNHALSDEVAGALAVGGGVGISGTLQSRYGWG
jgi:conjugal transfer mating pair stabilization protein TraG